MKYIIAVTLTLVLSGCEIKISEHRNIRNSEFSIICLDGVSYYKHISRDGRMGYMSVKLDRNSKVVQCEE